MKLYIVVTYYHLLISIIKCIHERGKHDLIIYGDTEDNSLIENNELMYRLHKAGIFNNIYIINYKKHFKNCQDYDFKFQLKRICIINNLRDELEKYKIRAYDNLYIFNDITTIGKCINKMNLKYILLEDGLNCFKNNTNLVCVKNPIKKIIKKFLYGSYQMGLSKNIIYIEVNDKKGIKNNGVKFVELNKKKLFQTLNTQESNEILNIFIESHFEISEDCNLIITQPLYQDKILSSEEDQIDVYKKIINDFCKNERIIIKNHPRENIIYNNYFSNILCLDKDFPLEILILNKDIKFKRVITISSTAVDMFDNCQEKIKLGWEWLYEKS